MTDLNTAPAPAASEQASAPPNSGTPPAPADNQGAPATPQADTAANPEEGEGQQPNKPPRGVQKRIDELTREKRELERRNHELAMAALRRGETPAANQNQNAVKEPKPEEFNSYNDYLKARDAWLEDSLLAKAERKLQERMRVAAEQQSRASRSKSYSEAVAKAAERYEDFEEVAHNPSLPITQAMAEVIQDAGEKGPDLAYWLGSHPDDAARISRLSPIAAARELGRIEATLTTPQPKKTTQAPEPPKTVAGKDTAAKDPDKLSMDEWVKKRNKETGLSG
jgi:hypothetical protein